MTVGRELFNERSEEVGLYFEFLEDIIDRRAKLIFPLPHGAPQDAIPEIKVVSLDLSHTLKANGYLLLYNLVEATISNAVEDIHRQIGLDGSIDADQLVHSLTERALKRFRSSNEKVMVEETPVSQMLLRHWLEDHRKKVADNVHPLFSGNVDARKIREVGDMYGFTISTDPAVTRNGAELVNVKAKRNDLAHGHVPFRECGRDVTLQDLSQIKREVIAYLSDVLTAVESYLADRKYLRTA